MNYQAFKDKLVDELQKLFTESKIEVYTVLKNNSTGYDTLTISNRREGLSPCIRIQAYYDDFMESSRSESFNDIVWKIVADYQTAMEDKKNNLCASLLEFNAIKDQIACRMINREMNGKLLTMVPFTEFMDEFAVIYVIITNQKEDGIESVRITNSLLKLWKVSVSELHQTALLNTIGMFPITSFRMEEMISKLINEQLPTQEVEESRMFVISNQLGINGATVLVYPDALKGFVAKYKLVCRYIFVLPSSTHELILVPSQSNSMALGLLQMVREVNESQVAEDEILSNNILVYDCRKDTLQLIRGEDSCD